MPRDRVLSRRRLLAYVIAAAAAPLSYAASVIYVVSNSGFGRGDLSAFGLWSTVFVVPLLIVLRAFEPIIWRRTVGSRALACFLAGALSGVVFTVVLALGMGPWIGAFSFPILYIWSGSAALTFTLAGLVAPLSPSPTALSVLKSSAAVLLGFGAVGVLPRVILFGSAYLWDRAEPELHLIPAGYEGPVVILFNDSLGVAARYEGKARRYDIPWSGVLRTQFGRNDGWLRPDYQYVDAQGNRSSIVAGAPCEDSLPGDPVQACLMGQMAIGGLRGREYTAYVVGRQANMRELYQRGESLVRAVVFGQSR